MAAADEVDSNIRASRDAIRLRRTDRRRRRWLRGNRDADARRASQHQCEFGRSDHHVPDQPANCGRAMPYELRIDLRVRRQTLTYLRRALPVRLRRVFEYSAHVAPDRIDFNVSEAYAGRVSDIIRRRRGRWGLQDRYTLRLQRGCLPMPGTRLEVHRRTSELSEATAASRNALQRSRGSRPGVPVRVRSD